MFFYEVRRGAQLPSKLKCKNNETEKIDGHFNEIDIYVFFFYQLMEHHALFPNLHEKKNGASVIDLP